MERRIVRRVVVGGVCVVFVRMFLESAETVGFEPKSVSAIWKKCSADWASLESCDESDVKLPDQGKGSSEIANAA